MKYYLLCIMLVLAACKQKSTVEPDSDNSMVSEVGTDVTIISDIDNDTLSVKLSENKNPAIEAFLGDTLVPMEIMYGCEECTDPYKKYGFAFSANCYDCNGIDISITDSVIYLMGSCGEDLLFKALEIERKETTAEDEIIIAVKDVQFIFSKIDAVEIYKLTIKGDLNLNEGVDMIRNYFTLPIDYFYSPRRELRKFATYDCGDFQG